MRPAALAVPLSGRTEEREGLLDVVRAGLAGSPRAVLVHGEAGIGKTALVRSICEEVKLHGAQVLWGQSLRFGAVEAMYHPLVLAMERWLAEAEEAERSAVIEALPAAALILPSLGAPPPESPSMLMMVVDALLSRVVARGPTVLVVDDVQWADPATWDALAYLVAGFGQQPLALVTTHRDEAAGSDGFEHWLGNIGRLPGTGDLSLTRLDRDATGDQVAVLLGRPPDPRLVEQVYERSGGNPYLSELLVRRGELDSAELPDDLPDELSHALLDTWRDMSDPAREIARILAIGGRPTNVTTLTALAAELGIPQAGSVREAVDAGVLVLGDDGAWFRHPLLAAVLAESYLPGEGVPVHATWAAHLETIPTDGVDELRRLGDLATHHERAGEGMAAFAALVQGADLAEKLGAGREAADLLARAAGLWQIGADPADTFGQARLLERAGRACTFAGRAKEGYQLLRMASDIVSPERDPLWASRLLLRMMAAENRSGEHQPHESLATLERVVDLSSVDPDSREHAEALGWLAYALLLEGKADEGRQLEEAAYEAAYRSGSAEAISDAHSLRAAFAMDTDLEQADLESMACWHHALASGEVEAIDGAFNLRLWFLGAKGDLRLYHEQARDYFEWSLPQGRTLPPSIYLAEVLLDLGHLVEAEGSLRTGLALRGSDNAEAMIRVSAALLASRRGELDAARDHVARAQAIMPHFDQRPECALNPPVAEVLLAADEPAAAFELVARVLPLNAAYPDSLDHLMVLGARATADLVQHASDERDQTAVQAHREALTRLVKARAALPGSLFHPSGPGDTVQPARAALFAAESGRAERVADKASLWRVAVAACAAAGMGWEQQVSSWRLAAALVASGASGTEAAQLLRGVHEYATRQGADPLRARVEELAGSARISLATPSLPSSSQSVPAAFTGLTGRENEVLAHLVANRTNAEIAEALFISEKTVSVHVSNLLRKTATGSRREVAALARRVGWGNGG